MNWLAPVGFRISCSNPRSVLRVWPQVDSLAARLAQGYIRSYSRSLSPLRESVDQRLRRKPSSQRWQQGLNLYALPASLRAFASRKIITRFENLPSYYNVEIGLQFRETPLTQAEADAIFGKRTLLDAKTADRLLRVIHGRRVAGTLEDPTLADTFDQQTFEVGLAWLRNHVPVDEILCAGLRAEVELAELEDDHMARAEMMGLYRPNSEEQKDIYGKSGLEEIRQAKERNLDEKEAKQKAHTQRNEVDGQQKTGTLESLSPRSKVELRKPGENPRLKYYLERSKVLPDTPPEMTKFQRLWPSAVVVLVFVGCCVVFASVYTPPRKEWRMWPDIPPSAATITGIILANMLILGAWRVPPLFRMLNKYFITVPGYPFPMSLIGNMFSHQSLSHFGMNMAVLWFVGTRLHEEVGRGHFLAIYLSCGAIGSFASLASWVMRNNFTSSSLGASGALCGILAAYLLLNGSEKVTFFGFPPEDWPSISALTLLILLIGVEVYGLKKSNNLGNIDHWAHLGGYFSGIGAAELLKMRARERKQMELERRKNLSVIDMIKEGRL